MGQPGAKLDAELPPPDDPKMRALELMVVGGASARSAAAQLVDEGVKLGKSTISRLKREHADGAPVRDIFRRWHLERERERRVDLQQRLAGLVIFQGMSVPQAAEECGVSRDTGYRWLSEPAGLAMLDAAAVVRARTGELRLSDKVAALDAIGRDAEVPAQWRIKAHAASAQIILDWQRLLNDRMKLAVQAQQGPGGVHVEVSAQAGAQAGAGAVAQATPQDALLGQLGQMLEDLQAGAATKRMAAIHAEVKAQGEGGP